MENFCLNWTEPPSAVGQELIMKCLPNIGHIHDQEGKTWEMEPAIAALQHELGRRQWHPTLVLLPGKSHGWRSLEGCSPWGSEESDTTERLHFHFSLSRIGEGNGNPLQCSCLENPRDGGAWWAAIYGVTQSWTRLKWLSSSSSSNVSWSDQKKENSCHLGAIRLQPLPTVNPEEMLRIHDYRTTESWGAYQGNICDELRLLPHPYMEKC